MEIGIKYERTLLLTSNGRPFHPGVGLPATLGKRASDSRRGFHVGGRVDTLDKGEPSIWQHCGCFPGVLRLVRSYWV